MKKIIMYFILTQLITACASGYLEDFDCLSANWFDLGKNTSTVGKPAKTFEKYQKKCAASIGARESTAFQTGYTAGLKEYCTYKTGYDQGRSGISDKTICPEALQTDFLKGYRKGYAAYEIELEDMKRFIEDRAREEMIYEDFDDNNEESEEEP